MRGKIVVGGVLTAVILPLLVWAQVSGSHGQHMMGRGAGQMGDLMQQNMRMMCDLMEGMSQMMGEGKMNREAHQHLMDMMNHMGQMLQQMAGTADSGQLEKQRMDLQDMNKLMEDMRRQMGK
jgi:ABC-type enterobactin transport system permease subunit